ncbi:MAG: IclR family transcriptional regulator [Micrococcales bacterium]|nr:IclR family transcriptional regulator [Micrococcales bacterium]
MTSTARTPGGRASSARGGAADARSASAILTVIEVLRCFTIEQPVQGVTEIAAKVGLHKSSVSRILATLEQEEIVERDPDSRRFRLGLGLISVAGPLLANLDARRVSHPMLQELSDETGETIALVVWSGSEAVTVEQVTSGQQIKHANPLGTSYRTAKDASVRVFLAQLPADRLRLLADGTSSLREDDPATTDAFVACLAADRERGYAVNFGQTSPEEVGIAAPVWDHRGEVVAAVLLAAPFYRVPEAVVPGLGAAVVRAAGRISARLGAVPAGPAVSGIRSRMPLSSPHA